MTALPAIGGSDAIVAAIMQPTYLPWIGYLDLLDQVDVFVFLDNVQFSSRSWQKRNRIWTANGAKWISIPVADSPRVTTIADVTISDTSFVQSHIGSMRASYRRSPGWARWAPLIEQSLHRHAIATSLAGLNMGVIADLAGELGIRTATVRASDLVQTNDRVGRLVELCQAVDAGRYISPVGSAGYLAAELNAFGDAGIELVFHHYLHPEYPQPSVPFLSHLSVVDALFSVDQGVLDLIRSGRRESTSAATIFAQLPSKADIGSGQ